MAAGIKVFRQIKAAGSKEDLLAGVHAILEFLLNFFFSGFRSRANALASLLDNIIKLCDGA